MTGNSTQEPANDFFISYSSADRTWAEWIMWQLKQDQFSVILPHTGLRSGSNFAEEVESILKKSERILAVLSPDYMYALYGQLEWAMIFREEAIKKSNLIVSVQVKV